MNQSYSELEAQKEKVTNGSPKLKIIAPCKLGKGILKLSKSESEYFEVLFQEIQSSFCFFIPASGSGSRMLDFLQIELEENDKGKRTKTSAFVSQIREFSFYKTLNETQKEKLHDLIGSTEFVNFLLKNENGGVGLQTYPKALVPFHSYLNEERSAFIEHLIQGVNLTKQGVNFHFTIQQIHEGPFNRTLNEFRIQNELLRDVHFSFQHADTDAFVFDHEMNMLHSNGVPVRRPSGHGALLDNLNAINNQYVLVKNIDNVQHENKAGEGIKVWKVLCGILHKVKKELKTITEKNDFTVLSLFNERYGLFSDQELNLAKSVEGLNALVNRPLRICGMVLNDGKAGGGPFFVELDGVVSKQIVEGVQVTGARQESVFNSSTHFNPVMMAIDTFDMSGNKYDLKDFSNAEQYFVVEKNYNGQKIKFMERPGLWNGSMFHWNTLFIEVPSASFTPVKTILDLLKPPHLSD